MGLLDDLFGGGTTTSSGTTSSSGFTDNSNPFILDAIGRAGTLNKKVLVKISWQRCAVG